MSAKSSSAGTPASPKRSPMVVAAGCACAALAFGAAGWLIGGRPAGLLIAVAGGLLSLAVFWQRLMATLRGAVIGAAFLIVVGPLADRLVFGRPVTERLVAAFVTGTLVGAAYGLLRSRRRSAAKRGGGDRG